MEGGVRMKKEDSIKVKTWEDLINREAKEFINNF
jgi:hypothetical protein